MINLLKYTYFTSNILLLLYMEKELILQCPHCKEYVIIEKINCAIFRHGILKQTNTQIDPHSKKEQCDFFIRENKIYGCGKPFRILLNKETTAYFTEICDYI